MFPSPKLNFKMARKSTEHIRSGRVVKPLVLYMKEYGSDRVEDVISTSYAQLCELDDNETKNIKIAAVGAGLGGRFNHTFKEAMNRSDSNKLEEENKNEHKRMVMNRV